MYFLNDVYDHEQKNIIISNYAKREELRSKCQKKLRNLNRV